MEDEPRERPIRQRRREKLRELLREFGGPKALAMTIGTKDTHLIAIEKGRRDVGDELASKLEEKTGKAYGWMDEPVAAEAHLPFRDLNAFEVQLVTLFRQLPSDEERQHALIELNHRLNATAASAPSVANPWAGANNRRKSDLGHTPERRGEVLFGSDGRRVLPPAIAKLVRK